MRITDMTAQNEFAWYFINSSTESKNMDSWQDFLEKQAAQVKEFWSESHLV